MKAIWTFLTVERGAKRRARPRRSQRGIALIMVLIAMAITLVITTDFGTATNVDTMASANYRDQMRAHFLARSSLDLSELVIRLQQRMDNAPKNSGISGVQITDFADQVMLAFCGSSEEVQAAVGFSPGQIKGLGADIGTCGVVGAIKTEDNKLNVNCANGTDPTAATFKSELDALLYSPAYDPIFDENDAEGWHRDRNTQVAAIDDYIDNNTSRNRERGTTEDYGYESLKDRYYAKNTYIDSIGELKLVRGVDDRFWSLFGQSFTVYGGCKVNLSAIDNTQIVVGLLVLGAKNPNDPVLQNPQQLFQLAGIIVRAKQFGETFSSVDDFVAFVKDPSASVSSLASQGNGTLAGSAANSALAAGIPGINGGQKLGMELDKTKISQMVQTGPRRVYRVEAWGEIPRATNADGTPIFPPIRTTITGVWDMKVVPQNVRKPPVPKGAWVFLKEE
jgi:general secretion pathway protein K